MAYRKGKQQFTKEEIIEILRRNVNLFRDEDEFVDYIVELALYLVEHRMQTQTEATDGSAAPPAAPAGDEVFEKRQEPFRRGSFSPSDAEVHDVLERHLRDPDTEVVMCRVCGATTAKKNKVCPVCGAMIA